jgi:hypothetical protein
LKYDPVGQVFEVGTQALFFQANPDGHWLEIGKQDPLLCK